MKQLFLTFILIFKIISGFAQINFDDYFLNKSMRVDYNFSGNSKEFSVFLQQVKEEKYWGGTKKNLLDIFDYGKFKVLVFDSASNKLIYSSVYSSLFIEWQDTDEAKTISRSFYESAVFPFPKRTVYFEIQAKAKNNKWEKKFRLAINPNDYQIIKDKPLPYKTTKVFDSGDPSKKIDIVFIAEGYQANEMEKFQKDAKRFIDYFFKVTPFKENKDKFNFWAVESVSEESGTDIPGRNIWKSTVLNTHFYTFGSERYLTTQDLKQLRDIAAAVPYDQIYIMVNTDIYGGGGFYNYYNLCAADNRYSEEVFTHEFGHAFADLADEYEYGYDKADQLYDMKSEIYSPNITNLVEFNKKWKKLIDPKTPIPTPATAEYKDKIGAFEGAGYVSKKVYRPMMDCKMRSNSTNAFCPVCKDVVIKMINFYCE
jgi:hypothetical protein